VSHVEDRWSADPGRRGRGKRWRVRWRDEARRPRSTSFELKRDAERFCRELDRLMDAGLWVDPQLGEQSFGEYGLRWLEGRRDLAPATVALYENLLTKHVLAHVGGVALGAITLETGQRLIAGLQDGGVGLNTVRKAGTLFRQIHQASVDEGLVAKFRLTGLRLPKEPRPEARFLTQSEFESLLPHVDADLLGAVLLGAFAGLRIGEVFGLQVGDVDIAAGKVSVRRQIQEQRGAVTYRAPKTASSVRTVAIPGVLVEVLAPLVEKREPGEALFVTESGAVVRPSNFRHRIWNPAVIAAGLGSVPFHALRHSSVSWAVEHGAHMRLIQQRLGHAKVTTTMGVYAHLVDHLDQELAETLTDGIRIPVAPPPRPQRCGEHRGLVSSPERWLSTFKGFGVVGDTGIEPVTSCVSCKRANQLRQSP